MLPGEALVLGACRLVEGGSWQDALSENGLPIGGAGACYIGHRFDDMRPTNIVVMLPLQ